MSSTTASRFTVDDSVAGFLNCFSHFGDAREYAMRLRKGYTKLTIYDRMARKGAAQEWEWNELFQDFACSKCRPFPEDECPDGSGTWGGRQRDGR